MSLSNRWRRLIDIIPSERCRAIARASFDLCIQRMRYGLPQSCALCATASGDALICSACTSALPRNGGACPNCALPGVAGSVCGACLKRPPPFATCIAAWSYAFPVDRLVQALKYGGQLALAAPMADALVKAIECSGQPCPDLVVALPLFPARQRKRGFNQAQEIARGIAAATGLRFAAGLARVREGPPQVELGWGERTRNMRGAYRGHPVLAGRRVAIVDDVMTTGATLSAAATAARNAGARDVVAWVVARTPRPAEGIAA